MPNGLGGISARTGASRRQDNQRKGAYVQKETSPLHIILQILFFVFYC